MACRKYRDNLETVKRSLVKAVAQILLAMVCVAIADWPEHLKLVSRQRVTILSDIILKWNLKLLLINYWA
jgi:hypothetical protein